jgi:hypothetical protein
MPPPSYQTIQRQLAALLVRTVANGCTAHEAASAAAKAAALRRRYLQIAPDEWRPRAQELWAAGHSMADISLIVRRSPKEVLRAILK